MFRDNLTCITRFDIILFKLTFDGNLTDWLKLVHGIFYYMYINDLSQLAVDTCSLFNYFLVF